MFFWQQTGLLMPPVVSITPRSTMLYNLHEVGVSSVSDGTPLFSVLVEQNEK